MPEDGYSSRRGRSRSYERRERAGGTRDGRRTRESRWDRSRSRERKEPRDRDRRREDRHEISRSRDVRKESRDSRRESRDEQRQPQQRDSRQIVDRERERERERSWRDRKNEVNRGPDFFQPDTRSFRGSWRGGRGGRFDGRWDGRAVRGRGRTVFFREIDRLKPEDVPRHGNYFLHDNRMDAEAMARQARRRVGMPRLSPDRWGHDKFSILEEEEMFEKERAKMEQESQSNPEYSGQENLSKLEGKQMADKEMEGIEQAVEENAVESKRFVSGVSEDQEMVDMTDKMVDEDEVGSKTACQYTGSK